MFAPTWVDGITLDLAYAMGSRDDVLNKKTNQGGAEVRAYDEFMKCIGRLAWCPVIIFNHCPQDMICSYEDVARMVRAINDNGGNAHVVTTDPKHAKGCLRRRRPNTIKVTG